MPKQTISFTGSNAVTTIQGAIWEPKEAPRGILQICHGMCEYIDRYEPFAEFMESKGFLVCGDTHLGHKDSIFFEDDLGFFGDLDGWKYLVNDQDILRQKIQKQYPDIPYFLLGHSMGSFITREYITLYSKGIRGYICCGTTGPKREASLAVLLAKLSKKIRGIHYRSAFLNRLAFSFYNKKFPKEEGAYAWISKNTENTKKYAQDPYCQFIFTTSGFLDLFTLVQRISSRHWVKMLDPSLPIFLISGEMDPVGNYGKGVKKIFKRLQKNGCTDLSLKLYPDDRHEILNEDDRLDVYQDILNWMEDRL